MKRSRWIPTVLLLCFVATPVVRAVPPWCAWTADQARKGCLNDAWADFHITRGSCTNIANPPGPKPCRRMAFETVKEELALCRDQYDARLDVCTELGGHRYIPAFDPEEFVEPDEIPIQNPYRSLAAGNTAVVRAGEELIVVHVTDEVKEIEGVPCRVVVDVALEIANGEDDAREKGAAVEYEPIEVTDDWYAYHFSGDIWYCGELSRNYEDGELADLEGSFEAGRELAKPGILIRFDPVLDELYRQEFALNEAEDLAQAISLTASLPEKNGGFDCEGMCLQTRDFSPLEPDVEEHKFYIAGVGFVLAVGFEDGERVDPNEQLICTGDSLEILWDEACGIEDPDALIDELCKLSPDAFCPDDS